MTMAFYPQEYVITPQTTYILINNADHGRRSSPNAHIRVGTESYSLSADSFLMPAHKDQAPPDLKYFKQTQK